MFNVANTALFVINYSILIYSYIRLDINFANQFWSSFSFETKIRTIYLKYLKVEMSR